MTFFNLYSSDTYTQLLLLFITPTLLLTNLMLLVVLFMFVYNILDYIQFYNIVFCRPLTKI